MGNGAETDAVVGKAGKSKGRGGQGESGLEQSFAAALRAAQGSPQSEDAWDHLEELADSLQRPDEVALAYREALEAKLTPGVRARLSRRAVQFHEEWFGDNPEAMNGLLTRIIEIDPTADWAFEQLTVVLTVGERWPDLLDLYDRALDTTTDRKRRKQLLDDAAHVAKDFADAPGKAVDYMQAQLELDPDHAQLAATIERLLERQRRYEDLIELWQARVPRLPVDEARATRVRVAACFLDRLEAAGPALDELRALLDESPGHAAACEQAERVLGFEPAPVEVRLAALPLLRTNYEAVERHDDVIRVVESAIAFAPAEERRALRREAGARHAIQRRDQAAIAHYADLLREAPADTDARKQLRALARRSALHEQLLGALVDAADASSDDGQRIGLLLEAADLAHESLGDAERGIALYQRVVELADADRASALQAAHRLNELLAQAGRPAERLAVLEQLGTLERAAVVRRAVLADAARLAAELGDADRALGAWRARVDADATDLEALDEMLAVLESNERWAELAEGLRRRAESARLPAQRRADLVRVATLQEELLQAPEDAVDTWQAIREAFGDEPDAIAALDRLLSGLSQWDALVTVLDAAARARRHDSAQLLARRGDVLRVELQRGGEAVEVYGHALGVDPANARAREGLSALIAAEVSIRAAASVLARAYEATGDIDDLLDLVEARVDAAEDAREAIRVLREAAALHETQRGDVSLAQSALARALVLDPADTGLEHELLRVVVATGEWSKVAAAFREAVAISAPSAGRAAHLFRAEGRIHEEQLGDPEAAVTAYAAAAELEPESVETQRAVIRVAARAGAWDQAARALVGLSRARGVVDREAVESCADAAAAAGKGPRLATALTGALATQDLPPELGRALYLRAAYWHREHGGDAVASEAAARLAVDHDPDHLAALELLVDLQRELGSPGLIASLLRLDVLVDNDVDGLHEAAELLLAEGDAGRSRPVLEQLYGKASRLFAHRAQAKGTRAPRDSAAWARDRLVELALAADERPRAVEVLLSAAQLPFDNDAVLDMLLLAARLLVELGERGRAIDLMLRVHAQRTGDLELVVELAGLCEAEGRVIELLGLRQRELALVHDPARRLDLRLQLSRIAGELEGGGGRLRALRENLEQEPGHDASIAALIDVMTDTGRFAALADVLSEQATALEAVGDGSRAAALWRRVARLVEAHFDDRARAIAALARVVELDADNEALDDLARLYLAQGAPADAADVLRRRLETTDAKRRVAVLLRLSRAQIQAEQVSDALKTLEVAFEHAPKNAEVRKLLLGIYRDRAAWEPLARALSVAAEHISDTATILAYAREAAQIFHDRLDMPDRAVPVLERAQALAPDDRKLKSMLAEGLRVAGRLEESRALLAELIENFGRRRSPERAAAHLMLAKVCHALGESDQALDQLEMASKMDAQNPAIMRTLAELARETGQLDRAERAYRALLLQLRRTALEAAKGEITPAEVLVELASIATDRGQAEQAQELVESALETIAGDDTQAPRLQRSLETRESWALLHRVLQTRLAHVEGPRRRARVLGDLAGLYAERLDDPAKAFETHLQALDLDPGSPQQHDRARALAEQLGVLDRYVEDVERLLERSRRNTDVLVRCELLLRLGEAMEAAGDLTRAADLLEQAEATGVREVDVWRARARLAGAQGDIGTQMELLMRLAGLGEEEADARTDALYRLAEVQLSSEETLDDGVLSLRQALHEAPRPERAVRILARATQLHALNPELLDMFDHVARQTDDKRALLDVIERRAALADTTPEYVREAVELATALDEPARAEALMLRAVELGANLLDGASRVGWALLGLARGQLTAGDLAGAVKWIGEAAEGAPRAELFALGREVADAASGPDGDPALAAKLYESLLERNPTARDVWEPLADLYRRLGDTDRLRRLVDETLDGLPDGAERNALRLRLAEASTEAGRGEDALEVLRAILLEDPEHERAQRLFAEHLEASGQQQELIDLLRQQLMAAQSRMDHDAIASLALRLGQRLEADQPDEARSTYQMGLDAAPANVALMRALLVHLDSDEQLLERAELLQRMLEVSKGDDAASLAVELADVHASLDDADASLRALVAGSRRAPGNPTLRARLEQVYEARGDYRGLAEMLLRAAEEQPDVSGQVALLRQAAQIHRELLSDPAASADLLRNAYGRAPDDADLALELASGLASAGDPAGAGEIVDGLLERLAEGDAKRAPMLLLRADLARGQGDIATALSTLEAALLHDPAGVRPALIDTLHERLSETIGDPEAERAATMRLVDLLAQDERNEQARALLTEWCERERKDSEALERLRSLETAAGNWDVVVKICARIIAISSGEGQVEAALALAAAATSAGKPADAKPGLEHARRKQPDDLRIREALRSIYEAMGAAGELAKLLVLDAEQETDPAERLTLLRRAADLLVETGEVEAALPALTQIVELAPGDLAATVALADAHTALGDLDQADVMLDGAMAGLRGRRTPELALLQHRKARLAGARGDHQGQLELLQQAYLTDKNNGQIAAELADLAEAVEAYDLAVKVLRTITLLDDSPISRTEAFLRQAKIAHRRDDRQRAVLWARKAKHESPEDGDVDAFLAELGEGE